MFWLLLFVVVKRRGGTIDRNNISIVNSTFRDEPHPHGDFRFIICYCIVAFVASDDVAARLLYTVQY